MAKKSKAPKTLLGAEEFAGPDADKEAIEKITAARAAQEKEGAKGGNDHNGEPVFDEEAWRSASQRTLAETLEIDKLNEQIAECRGRISSIKKTARAQGVPWNAVKDYVADERRIMKGELGEMITEQRHRGQMHSVMGSALHDQGFFNFGVVEREGEAPKPKPGMDAELQGQAAARNLEPEENNPFMAGTPERVDWQMGHRNAKAAMERQFDKNMADDASAGVAA
jgi:hypothetical protein